MAFRIGSKPRNAQLSGEEIRYGKDVSEWFDKTETIPQPIKATLNSYSGLNKTQVIPHTEDIVRTTLPSALNTCPANPDCSLALSCPFKAGRILQLANFDF